VGWGGVDEAGDQEGEADQENDHDTDGDESAVMAINGTPAGGVRDYQNKANRLKSIPPGV